MVGLLLKIIYYSTCTTIPEPFWPGCTSAKPAYKMVNGGRADGEIISVTLYSVTTYRSLMTFNIYHQRVVPYRGIRFQTCPTSTSCLPISNIFQLQIFVTLYSAINYRSLMTCDIHHQRVVSYRGIRFQTCPTPTSCLPNIFTATRPFLSLTHF